MGEQQADEGGIDPGSERRCDRLDALMGRLGIDSALVGVPKLARALGMGASTLYAYIRAGTFFLPYRMVNGTPMVRVDDLVDWYLSTDADIRPRAAPSPAPGARPAPDSEAGGEFAPSGHDAEAPAAKRARRRGARPSAAGKIEFEPADVWSKREADQAVDGVVASVLARMERARGRASADAA